MILACCIESINSVLTLFDVKFVIKITQPCHRNLFKSELNHCENEINLLYGHNECFLSYFAMIVFPMVVYNHWTGIVDWNGGMEWWNPNSAKMKSKVTFFYL